MLIDLQMHSTYSDGYLSPTELAALIAKKNIRVAALTDHNTVAGLREFAKAASQYGFKAIKGMELYVKLGHKRFNVLWYNFDEDSAELHKMLRDSQKRRRQQMRAILEKLTKRGFKIEINKILDKHGHYVPINHIIDDITAIPQNFNKIKRELKINNFREEDVIKRYFKNPDIGVLLNSYINVKRIIKLRKKIGGQLVLCHPAKHSYLKKDFVSNLKKLGFDGIELLSPHHTHGAIMQIQQIAKEFNLITTGGSDFHRFEGSGYAIQGFWEYFQIDSKYLRGVDKIIK